MDNGLGDRIYSLRTKKQMTQDALAEKTGVSRQAISKWERGEGYPDYYNITALARALEVSVDELVGEKKDIPEIEPKEDNLGKAGNYLKRLLYKAQHTTNTAEAKKIKKTLLILGAAGLLVGGSMTLISFFGFGAAAMDAVENFGPGSTGPGFNPLVYAVPFLFGGIISGLSAYILYGGLAITIASVTTNFLDERKKCPKCGDRIDKDEMVCSSCGYDLSKGIRSCPKCGYDNEPSDNFCRKCGTKL